MKPKFYYLHGFNSGPDKNSERVKHLESLGEVICLQYDSFDTYDNIMAHLIKSIHFDIEENVVIVGTSLGGFYASQLGKLCSVPCVLINPAMKPFESLKDEVGNTFTNYKTEEVRTLEQATIDSYKNKTFQKNRTYLPLVLLDEGDEILDAKKSKAFFLKMNCAVVSFEGGSHRFDHMEQSLPMVSKYVDICEYIADF